MNCKEAEALLSEYVDATLDEVRHGLLELHLSSCAACRAEVDALKAVVEDISALPSLEVPLGFSKRVMAEIEKEPVKAKFWEGFFASFKMPAQVFTVLLVAGLAVYLYHENPMIQEEMKVMAPQIRPIPKSRPAEEIFENRQERGVQGRRKQGSEKDLRSQVVEAPLFKKKRVPKALDRRAKKFDHTEVSRDFLKKSPDPQFVFRPHSSLSQKEFLKILNALLKRLEGTFGRDRLSSESSFVNVLDVRLPAVRLSEFKEELAIFGTVLSKKNTSASSSQGLPSVSLESLPPDSNSPSENVRVMLFLEFKK